LGLLEASTSPSCLFLLAIQNLGALLALVHRRCADPKAAVRKGALQLLEHLVVMRASWQGYHKQLPSAEDLLLLEAATADPLVSRGAATAAAGAVVWASWKEGC
jgi:hypothetical protein